MSAVILVVADIFLRYINRLEHLAAAPGFAVNLPKMGFNPASISLLVYAVAAALILSVQGQQDFTTAAVPNPFQVGDYYPPRPEVEVCRPIRDYIDRNSARFMNELVTNTNNDIVFSTADSRIMSSRMQSRLNTLAALYLEQTGRRMTVERAWVPFPSGLQDDMSLHYEGEVCKYFCLRVWCIHVLNLGIYKAVHIKAILASVAIWVAHVFIL